MWTTLDKLVDYLVDYAAMKIAPYTLKSIQWTKSSHNYKSKN